MTPHPPIHESLPCVVVTRRGAPCESPSVQYIQGLGPICALHAYHRRRSSQPRQHFQCRVTTLDLEALDRSARAHGLSRSDAVRHLIHHLPFPRSMTDASTYRELRKIGVNINQIARALNSGEVPDAGLILPRLDDLACTLEELALKIASGIPDDEAKG